MLSWTSQYQLFQSLAQDQDATVLTFGKQQINFGQHLLESELGSYVTENSRTGSTSASTNIVNLPEDFIRLKTFYVTVGSVRYNCDEVFDEDVWQALMARTSGSTSDFALKVFRRRTTLEIYPQPSSVNTWTMIYEATTKYLSQDDYTTGTVTTLANGGTALTLSGSALTNDFIGRYFKVNSDGAWYEITAVGSATTATLRSPYQGIAISAGTSAYTIGEFPRTPGPTHHIPVYYALWQYYEGIKKDAKFGLIYKGQYEQYQQWAKATYGRRYSTQYIPSQRNLKRGLNIINPNYYPEGLS